MTREHRLKVAPEYWDPLLSGEKTLEVRRDDRGFQRGDILLLVKTALHNRKPMVIEDYRGEPMYVLRRRIAWILTGGQFGIEPGYVVMAIEPEQSDKGTEHP